MPYYLFDGKAAIGPFEAADLAKRPGFGASSMVCPLGATSADAWKPAGSFPDLAAALAPAAPPPPPPPPPPPVATPRAEITLTLPPERPREPEPVAAPAPAEPVKPAPAAAPAGASPADKYVLIVDDDDAIREFIEMIVTTQGFQVFTARNGLEATAKLATHAADLIVTDLMMPGQGGYEFLRTLQSAGGAAVPVFVVSASQLDDSTIRMIRGEANVVEFIPKPISMPLFSAALHKHLKTVPR